MNTVPVNTLYGIIYGRNALILKEHSVAFSPLSLMITCSLSRSAGILEILDVPDVEVVFDFTDVRRICLYKVDDFPYEKYTSSTFDKVEDGEIDDRYILSTYDYVFDIAGKLESIQGF